MATKTGKALSILKPRNRLFVELYTKLDPFYYGNGTKCYAKAYNIEYFNTCDPRYKAAQKHASRLLGKEKITRAINEQLDMSGFNSGNADKELLFLMSQHNDLKTKLGAIREFNALKKRTGTPAAASITAGGNMSITMLFQRAEEEKKKMLEGVMVEDITVK